MKTIIDGESISVVEGTPQCIFNKKPGYYSISPFPRIEYNYYQCDRISGICIKLTTIPDKQNVRYYCHPSFANLVFMPNPGPGNFTPLYDHDQTKLSASINAGDVGLYVGGGTINGAFGLKLRSAGQQVDKYQDLHQMILKKSPLQRYNSAENINDYPEFLSKTLLLQDNQGGQNQGTVFLHIFKEPYFPMNNPKNNAMIYVVPPNGKISNVDGPTFLKRVKKTATNIGRMVSDYNLLNSQKIEKIRVCLFSGEAYRHKSTSKIEVAKNILTGLIESTGVPITYEFAYDQDVFTLAYQEL